MAGITERAAQMKRSTEPDASGGISTLRTMCRSLADAWADTTTPHGRLMLTVLGGLAEFERELIRARTGEGRARARRRVSTWDGHGSLTPTNVERR
jgi:DNA invertase Pin-like site-specific DNA recombinase